MQASLDSTSEMEDPSLDKYRITTKVTRETPKKPSNKQRSESVHAKTINRVSYYNADAGPNGPQQNTKPD